MKAEYRFDYALSKDNRFADRMAQGSIAVVLDPDVASVFKSSEAVNALLRSVIAAIRPPSKSKVARSKPGVSKRAKAKRAVG